MDTITDCPYNLDTHSLRRSLLWPKNALSSRLAAILAADVVGYSQLMEADEAGTLAALKERRKTILEPTIRSHGGRIVKVMGDGVLVEFGSAVNAVERGGRASAKDGECQRDHFR